VGNTRRNFIIETSGPLLSPGKRREENWEKNKWTRRGTRSALYRQTPRQKSEKIDGPALVEGAYGNFRVCRKGETRKVRKGHWCFRSCVFGAPKGEKGEGTGAAKRVEKSEKKQQSMEKEYGKQISSAQ